MTRRHQRIDQGFIFRVEYLADRGQVIGPLLERARPGNHRADDLVTQHPCQRELGRSESLFAACALMVCAIAIDSSRNSVSIIRRSLRATREPDGGSAPGE